MNDEIAELRQKKLQELIDSFSTDPGNRAAFCRAHGLDPLQIGQYFTTGSHGRNIGERKARHIEKMVGLEPGWLDQIDSNRNKTKAATPIVNEQPTNESLNIVSLTYVTIEEIELLTAFREANDMGKNMFKAAILTAPRDQARIRSIKNL
ncbi:hypothetical protein ACO0LF_03635 [Undibacterium sp. Di27W]|uniref:hypothetical protein n=1 Tax=Undibacterium sp. Di27W TaxID=3413036 RepID=UPI003BEF75A7